MLLGINLPNFGVGTDPGVIREWAARAEGLQYELLMMSDHLVVTPDVAEQYPAPFYEPLTTLAWLAAATTRIRLGTTVLIVPYRHPLQVARVTANLNDLSGGRFVLGVGVGWAQQEFAALGADFAGRGARTDEYLLAIRTAWRQTADYRAGDIPIWVGGNGDRAIRRAVRLGDGWHPIHLTRQAFLAGRDRLHSTALAAGAAVPGFIPRLQLSIRDEPVTDPGRLAGTGSLEQIESDLSALREAGAEAVVLDTFTGDLSDLGRPEAAWAQLELVAGLHRRAREERRSER